MLTPAEISAVEKLGTLIKTNKVRTFIGWTKHYGLKYESKSARNIFRNGHLRTELTVSANGVRIVAHGNGFCDCVGKLVRFFQEYHHVAHLIERRY